MKVDLTEPELMAIYVCFSNIASDLEKGLKDGSGEKNSSEEETKDRIKSIKALVAKVNRALHAG